MEDERKRRWPEGGGEMAGRIRAHDWSATPLGPIEAWPLPLCTAVEMMLASPMLATLAAGSERVLLYNDEAARHYGDRHPSVLGRPLAHAFADVAPFYDRVLRGESLHVPAQRLEPSQRGTAQVFDAYLTPVRDVAGDVIAAHMTGFPVGERLHAEAILHANEERQAFLLGLSDALRPVGDPVEVQRIATRMLGRHLGASRVFYVVVGADGDTAEISDAYADGVPSRVGRYSLGAFSSFALGEWRAGRTAISSDVDDDTRYSPAERDAYASVSTRAGFGVPLIKEGRLVALLGVNQAIPRLWSDDDVGLASEVAERTWTAVERAQAEAALRESEERYRAIFASIDEGVVTFDVIFDASGKAVDASYLEYNAAFSRITGLTTDIVGKRMLEVRPDLEPFWLDTFGRVIETGEPSRFEYAVHDRQDQWFDVFASRVGGEGTSRIVLVYNNITERKRTEVALRESEEWQSFLLELSDLLRPLSDSAAIQGTACRLLADHLSTDRAYYVEVDEARGIATVEKDYVRGGSPSLAGQHTVASFSWSVDILRRGECHVVDDARTSTVIPEDARDALLSLGIVACMGAPLIKHGELVGALCVTAVAPRTWSEADVDLLREVGERIWATVERARAEAALAQSEQRFRQFAAASSNVLWIRDAETLAIEYVSPAALGIYGIGLEALRADTELGASLIVPEDRSDVFDDIGRVRRGESVVHDYRIRRPSDGDLRRIRSTGFPLFDDHGRVQRIGGIAEDVTELRATEAALALSEGRLRTLMEGVPQLVWRAVDGGHWTWASPQWTAYTGQAEEWSHGVGWLDTVHPADRDAVMAVWAGAVGRGEFHDDYRLWNAAESRYVWFQSSATPVRDERGAVVEWLGTSTDVDDLRTLQQRQQVLVAELQHRTRNLIAVVCGIADDTMEETGPTEVFRDVLFDRLEALSRVQGLLSRSEAEPITIGALVRLELDAVGAGAIDGRVSVGGPEVFLKPSTVQTLALALHELATNARKYGALSHDRGRLAVTWRGRDEAGEHRLMLDWIETGLDQVPARAASAKRGGGYGRELIERALPHAMGATTSYNLTSSRLSCSLDIPARSRRGEGTP